MAPARATFLAFRLYTRDTEKMLRKRKAGAAQAADLSLAALVHRAHGHGRWCDTSRNFNSFDNLNVIYSVRT